MKIKDIMPKQTRVDIVAEVAEISSVKEFSKFGKIGKVATATLKDDSGEISLTLWDEQTDMIKKGVSVKITNAYVKEWQGERQVNIGKYGSIEILG